MTNDELTNIIVPLNAAHEYSFMALAHSSHADERDYFEKKMLNRLCDALLHAGYRVEKPVERIVA